MKWYLCWEVEKGRTYHDSDREEYDTEEHARRKLEELKTHYAKDIDTFIYVLIHGNRVEYK